MRLEGNHPRTEELSALLGEVPRLAGVATDRLAVLLDTVDYANEQSISDCFRKPAALVVCEGINAGVPPALHPFLTNPGYRCVIWLSKQLLNEELEQISWVFSHEFRHFMHRIAVVDANEIGCALQEIHQREGAATRYSNLDRPEELDCELFAHEMTQRLFGSDAVESFIARRTKEPQGLAYYSRLKYLARELQTFNSNRTRPPSAAGEY